MDTSAFVSYTAANKAAAREIAVGLVALGAGVWFDEWEIRLGDSITTRVQSGLSSCTHFIVLWSVEASRSKWVGRELNSTLARALEAHTPQVLPILLDDTPLPALLSDIKYVRWAGLNDQSWRELSTVVTGQPAPNSVLRAVVDTYHNLVYADDAGPFGLVACPGCGGTELKYTSQTTPLDDLYHFVECRECGWSDWTQ